MISGINRGGNVGENVYYSGTIGAAMEGALNRVPSIAISLAYKGKDADFGNAVKFAQALAPLVLKEGLPAGVLLNVNVPQPWKGSVRFVRQSSKITRNVLQPGKDPRGRSYYWLHEQQIIKGVDPDTDQAAVREGAISVTPLVIDHTHTASLNHLSHWTKFLEAAAKR